MQFVYNPLACVIIEIGIWVLNIDWAALIDPFGQTVDQFTG